MKKRLICFSVLFLLAIAFIIVLFIGGNKYTIRQELYNNDTKLEEYDFTIVQEDEVIKINNKKIVDNEIIFEVESINKGRAFIDIANKDDGNMLYSRVVYVHSFGLITEGSFFGKTKYDIVIPIYIVICILMILLNLIKKYQSSLKNNIYQYKNVLYLGLIIFLSIVLLQNGMAIINNDGLIGNIERFINSFDFFSFVLLPVCFFVSIFVTISNIILIKREGFNLRNTLGIMLGLFFCFLTVIPGFIENFMHGSNLFLDIHNEKGIFIRVFQFIKASILAIVSHLECVLLGTIILSLKASKHNPNYDKDYVIILGCKIQKDGNLTKLLKGRVDRAIEFATKQKEETGKDIVFIPSGGQGSDEVISEALAMKNYLIENGIKEKNIILEDKSTNTLENFNFSHKLMKKKNANIAFSTTNYHVFRSGLLATGLDIKVEGMGAKTRSYFWINAFIREYIATLYYERKKHLFIILLLLIMILLMVLLLYLSVKYD